MCLVIRLFPSTDVKQLMGSMFHISGKTYIHVKMSPNHSILVPIFENYPGAMPEPLSMC